MSCNKNEVGYHKQNGAGNKIEPGSNTMWMHWMLPIHPWMVVDSKHDVNKNQKPSLELLLVSFVDLILM